ncbi:MAG: M23 family metallopeptidase [Synergistaceae bacterium]|jgi:hypothetical protein|nr:M23 family metallopeptidase [Synergistaceae bacterium]
MNKHRMTRIKTLRECACLFIAGAFLLTVLSGVSRAEEERQTFIWSDGAAGAGRFEKLCEERGVTSADVFRVNGCEMPPAAGETLLMPRGKRDLNAVWMEVQIRKSGGAAPLVSVKLHSIPKKLRAGYSPSAAVSGNAPLPPSPRFDLSAAAANAKPAAKAVSPPPPAAVPAPAERKTAVQAAPGGSAAKDGKMTWPVSGKITSGFGRRGKRRFHFGIDIPMPKGTPILAARDGVVLDVGTNKNKKYRGYGNTALLDHGNGIVTLYAHCQSVSVKKGQTVKRGDVIGFVGSSGRATTAHVHFEVRKNGKAVNPLPYLANRQK